MGPVQAQGRRLLPLVIGAMLAWPAAFAADDRAVAWKAELMTAP
ncbi:MAG: hypothetical protein M0Z49_03710 [Chloroflexi bacterium]|nr:hypothetical protein [Chloroflexota bacterium]